MVVVVVVVVWGELYSSLFVSWWLGLGWDSYPSSYRSATSDLTKYKSRLLQIFGEFPLSGVWFLNVEQ